MLKRQSSLKAICMAMAALTALSCSEDELAGKSALNGNTTIVASFEGAGINTRTSVNDVNEVVWNKDDAFGLFYTSSSQQTPTAAEFTCADADGTSTSASFTGTLSDGATTTYAVYPYKAGMSLSGNTVAMNLPNEFAYTQASNGPMYAPANDITGKIAFKHLAGLLKLTVSKGITSAAKKFVITADKDIAGNCTADLNGDNPVLAVTENGNASKTITVSLDITGEEDVTTTFYVPIPVGTYTTLSAKLLDSSNSELFPAKEWTNVTVARAGMLTASFGFVEIKADTESGVKDAIAAALPTEKPATETTTELQITGAINTSSTGSGAAHIANIEIPVLENSNVNLALTEIPVTTTSAPLVLKDNNTEVTNPTEAVNTVTVAIPKVSTPEAAPDFTITMPRTTVELDATSAEGTTYGKVIAKTANNTLVIKQGVTVKDLVVAGGNVRVAGKIEKISKDKSLSGTVYIIKEAGATIPSESITGFTVIDAAAYDMKAIAENGGTYQLNADVVLSEPLVVKSTMILDLNGHKITPNSGGLNKVMGTKDGLILVLRKANLTINDSSNEKNGSIDCNNIASVPAAVKLTDNTETGTEDVTLTVNGGSIKGYYYGIIGNGDRHGTHITINGGTIEGAHEGSGIFNPQDGTLTVTGGTISSDATGIEMRAGRLTISGGTIKTTANHFSETPNLSGTTITGAAVAVSQHTTNKNLQVTIKGGNLEGGSYYALYEKDLQDSNVSNISMEVTGGNFDGKVYSQNCKGFIKNNGSTFSHPSALNYLAENVSTELDLKADISIIGDAVTIPEKAQVTLDLNGHTITAGNINADRITVWGKLTLKDSKTGGKIAVNTSSDVEGNTGLVAIYGKEASMIMDSGTIDAVRTTNVKGQNGIIVLNSGSFTMNGGEIKAKDFAISGHGNYKNEGDNSIIEIKGGKLTSTNDYALYFPQKGTTTISGGEVIGAAGGIGMRSGNLVIKDNATITCQGTGSTGESSDGTGGMQYAVINVATGNANTYTPCTVTIEGGRLIASQNATGIAKRTNATHTINIEVSGGSFTNFNPANDGTGAGYVASGFEVKCDGNVTTDAYNSGNGDKVYIVSEKTI